MAPLGSSTVPLSDALVSCARLTPAQANNVIPSSAIFRHFITRQLLPIVDPFDDLFICVQVSLAILILLSLLQVKHAIPEGQACAVNP
jgi:hypothetical protein